MTWFGKHMHRSAVIVAAVAFLCACGGGGGSSVAPVNVPQLTGLPIPPAVLNELAVTVDAGPSGTGYNANRLYTDVTVCTPGNITQCQTIKHVLVDTGSTGLRLLASAMAPGLNLPRVSGDGSLPLLNCVNFIDNTFAWGPVALADVVLAGRTAKQLPIQVIADTVASSLGPVCASGGSPITTASTLGANGILGVGLFKEDCGPQCALNPRNGVYFTCTTSSCSAVVGSTAALTKQVTNPVSLFSSDSNGVVIDLPAVTVSGLPSLTGKLVFGIGTQVNNQAGATTVLFTNSVGRFTTQFGGQIMPDSFIDSGSNGLYFDSSIPLCGSSVSDFYCPPVRLSLSATLIGVNLTSSGVVTFAIDNATTLFVGGTNTVFTGLGGNINDSAVFDWGLPFFYGRRVFFGIEDESSPLGTGPYYAF
jgi:hypothetical protein